MMLKTIFYIQLVLVCLCESIAIFANFYTRPLADFDSEQIRVETLITKNNHFFSSNDLAIVHYFTTALYKGGCFNFYMLQVTCILLAAGAIIGLKEAYSRP